MYELILADQVPDLPPQFTIDPLNTTTPKWQIYPLQLTIDPLHTTTP